VVEALWLVGRLLEQMPKSKNKIHFLHEPEADCISKGKARIRYEFGTKVSLAEIPTKLGGCIRSPA
jgi:transposase, IS5 family